MLIGQGSVGKTSMQCALRSPPHHRAVAIEIDDRTDGISIEEWRPKEGFVGHIWDFAGQEEYYSTHMFFLSARAIYILVWKLGGRLEAGGKDEEMIYFWLESLHLHAPGSTVMLVGTHLEDPELPLTEEQVQQQTSAVQRLAQQQLQNHDKRLENQKRRLDSQIRDLCIDTRIPWGSNDGQDVSLHELKHVLSRRLHLNGRYEQCMAMVDERLRLEEQKGLRLVDKNLDGSPMCVDCITGAGMLKLKDTLICQAAKLPHFGMQVPRSFVGLRDKMWELKKDKCTLLSPEQYVMYAAEAGIPEGQKLEDATRFWHGQGWVLRFTNTASAELNGAVFTDPEWLINVLKKVVGRIPIQVQDMQINIKINDLREHGKLHHALLPVLWPRESGAQHSALLGLLEHFHVVVTLDEPPRAMSLVTCRLDPMDSAEKHELLNKPYAYKARVAFCSPPEGFFGRFLAHLVQMGALPKAVLERRDVIFDEENETLVVCETKINPFEGPSKCFYQKDNAVLTDLEGETCQMHILIMTQQPDVFNRLLGEIQKLAKQYPGTYYKMLLPCPRCHEQGSEFKGWFFDFSVDCHDGNRAEVQHGRLHNRHKVETRELIGSPINDLNRRNPSSGPAGWLRVLQNSFSMRVARSFVRQAVSATAECRLAPLTGPFLAGVAAEYVNDTFLG
ncbi:hypothetical protein CYMTET_51618 [Cymbomonas tetramitiformis]|uniref:non-specific serine/threonine protein kinase n=1 Tax=Cymbomonas tetramitiformis TaxID=36881 RepID=A0AAE0BMJ5_9CHLO|nr:hypothetical protein CYMTET_51618 [Cymbomonas tetramitiformis]